MWAKCGHVDARAPRERHAFARGWGEATALRVRHLNTVRRRLHVEENAVQVDGVIHLGTPKSSEHRHVPYPRFLEPYLVQLTAGKGPESLLFGDGLARLRTAAGRHGVVRGRRLSRSSS